PGESGKQREEKARRALRAIGMETLARRRIEQLSGGQKQRVALARALVVEPALILLDEPLGSLDARLRIEMQSELKSLQRQMGITFIHVSHNQVEALVMADRIAVMNAGRFEQVATPTEIYKEPRTRFVAEFVGRNNIFEGEVAESRNGIVRVQTRHGVFAIEGRGRAPAERQKITFVVRADSMRPVDAGGAPTENVVSGVIKGLEYAGSVMLMVLNLGSDQELKVEQQESLILGRGWRANQAAASVGVLAGGRDGPAHQVAIAYDRAWRFGAGPIPPGVRATDGPQSDGKGYRPHANDHRVAGGRLPELRHQRNECQSKRGALERQASPAHSR